MRYVLAAAAAFGLAALAAPRSPLPQSSQGAASPAGEYKIPDEFVKKANPVKATPEGLETVRRLYGFDCAMCHGKEGDGKGELAEQMKLELKDWRNPVSLEKMTDGELFYIITKGKGKMVAEGDRAKEEQRWQLVNLIRSLAKKKE
jgi:mono/diheme cytochrome c family protein